MRTALAALMLFGAISHSNAACSTAKLAGQWLFGQDDTICTFNIAATGKGSAACSQYYGGEVVETARLSLSFALAPSCLLTGRVYESSPANYIAVKGRSDAAVTIVVGTLLKYGPFTMTRN